MRRDGAAIVLLLLWTAVLFGPPLLRGDVLAGKDLHDEIAPLRSWLERAWQATGTVPGWNRHLFCGYPNANALRSELLYPLDVFYDWTAPLSAYSWSVALHFFLGAVGAYFCARGMGISRAGALLTAVLFSGSFPLRLRIFAGHVNQVRCGALIPWNLLLVEKVCRAKFRWLFPLALGVALQALVWSPDLLAYSLYAYILYGLVRHAPRDAPVKERARRLAVLLLAITAGMIPLLPTLLPMAGLAPELSRGAIYPSPVFNQAGPLTFMTLVAPEMFGTPLDTSYWGQLERFNGMTVLKQYPYWEETIFIGVMGLILALLGISDRRWKPWLPLLTVLGAALLVALGEHTPLYAVVRLLPGIGEFRVPSRTLLLAALLLALYAGHGLDRLSLAARPLLTRRLARAAAIVAGGLGVVAVGSLIDAPFVTDLLRRLLGLPVLPDIVAGGETISRSAAVFLGSLLAALGGICLAYHRGGRYRWLLVVLAALELQLIGGAYVQWIAAPVPPAWVSLIEPSSEPFRVLIRPHTGFAPDRCVTLGLETCNGADPMRLGNYHRWVERINGQPEAVMASELQIRNYTPEILAQLNVRYVLSSEPLGSPALQQLASWPGPPPTYFYRNDAPAPRAFLLDEAGRAAGEVNWVAYDDDRVVIDVAASSPATLVIRSAYQAGWTAAVDGVAVPVNSYQDVFCSVVLPPGGRRVALQYHLPYGGIPWWTARLWLWLLAIAAVLSCGLTLRRYHQK